MIGQLDPSILKYIEEINKKEILNYFIPLELIDSFYINNLVDEENQKPDYILEIEYPNEDQYIGEVND